MDKQGSERSIEYNHCRDQTLAREGQPLQTRFFHKEFKSAQDVILLCRPEYIAQKIMLSSILWLDVDHKGLSHLSRVLPIEGITSLEQALDKAKHKLVSTLIVSNKLSLQDIRRFQGTSVVRVIIYCMNRKFAQEKMQKEKLIVGIATTLEELKEQINCLFLNDNSYVSYSSLIVLSEENMTKFSRKRMALYGIDKVTNLQDALQDYRLLQKCLGVQNDFRISRQKNMLTDPELMLHQYISEASLYKTLNKCLKIAEDSTEAGWIRNPFRMIRMAISNRHKKRPAQKMTVYRGAFFSSRQLELLEQGMIYQSLGFMSTTQREDVAKKFVKNCFISITVNDPDRKSEGFCSVKDISKFPEEEEILFNPFNLFRLVRKIQKAKADKSGQLKYDLQFEHLPEVTAEYSEVEADHQFKQLRQSQGRSLNQFDSQAAEIYFQKCIQTERDQQNLASFLSELAKSQENQGKYDQSIECYGLALAINQKLLGSDHPKVADNLQNMGLVYDDQGKHQKAIECYEKSLAINMNVLGIDHPKAATTLNNMGLVYKKRGKHEKAIECYEKALKINMKVLGQNHSKVATTLNNMGLVYKSQGKCEMSIECYQKALEINMKVLGKNHTKVAATLNNMGNVYDDQGKHLHAIYSYDKALTINMILLGKDHPKVATTLNNMGLVYKKLEKYDKAIDCYEKALAINMEVLGKDHPKVATTLNNMSLVYKKQGKHDKAIDCQAKSKAIFQRTIKN